MNKEEVIKIISGKQYYTTDDLRYNKNIGLLFSKEKNEEYIEAKDELLESGFTEMREVPLKSFNSKHIYYVNGRYIRDAFDEYIRILSSDMELNQTSLFNRNSKDILLSRLFSEIEGTLSIENIPTTQKHIAEISKTDNPAELNDIIIKNMLNAIRFIIDEEPEFNKENLRKLYLILSNNCIEEKHRIKDGIYYRDAPVYIGAFEGADCRLIEECMDSLFAFAGNPDSLKKHGALLPYICQYYILYIHPYFDYNGRTARMVSFWLSYILAIDCAPYFMSEAINENKNAYYKAITNTRTTGNDLTYFLGYILETSIKFSFVYKNLEEIKKQLSKTGDALTSGELVYVKKILVHNPDGFFTYKMFLSYINTQMTIQGAMRILKNLLDFGILIKSTNKRGDSVFRLNQDYIKYKYTD